jgi:hypothetical protein
MLDDLDCSFAWEDLGSHMHYCVMPPDHTEEHVCDCGERHETEHEGE